MIITVSTEIGEQACRTQTAYACQCECLSEQKCSTLAKQSHSSRAANENYRKLLAEHHMQSDHVKLLSAPIKS